MANSYSTHQHAWQRGSLPYSASLHLEPEYTVPSSNGRDNTKGYSQSNSSNTASLTNGTAYPHSSPSHVASYGSNQPIQGSGSYTFAPYSAPSAQNEDTYDGFPSQSLSDHSYGDSLNNSSYSPAGSHMNDNAQVSNVHYISPIVPQHDLKPSYPYSEAFQFQATDAAEMGLKSKRRRHLFYDTSDEQEVEQQENKEGSRPKPGACSRCKTLKVKCEFKTDTDPCKRCLNGGHECVIPGRKKRRAPPKREHLLNQIREQAAQIQKLMSQLEVTNKGNSDRPLTPDLLSPLMSPVPSPTQAGSETNGTKTPDHNQEAVTEWIARAKESLDVFGDHISMAGASMPRNLLAGHDQEDEDEDDGYYTAHDDDDDDEVAIAVERLDVHGNEIPVERIIRNRDSGSSLNSGGGSPNHAPKKIPEEKAAIIPTKASPFGLFGHMGLRRPRGASVDPEEQEDKDATGIAGDDFFRPASTPTHLGHRLSNIENVPPILSRGLITGAEAEALFKIYFDNMNLSLSLLDPVLYTAQNTFVRSPFLFTVICAISSRFYSKRPDLYQQAMRYAQMSAGMALINGKKDVDMCHAYILMSLCPLPVKRLEDQRSWLYLGLAIRVATELNLHLPVASIPQDEKPAREVLNRARVWMNCFNLDRSTGGQYGKPPIINSMDYQATHSQDWWKSSPFNMRNFDIQICCYNHCLRTTAAFVAKIYNDPENPTGLNQNADFERLAAETDDQLQTLRGQWARVIKENTDSDDYQNKFRTRLLGLAYSYGRLIVLSYGFQHAFGKNNTDENPFLLRCLNAAEDVLQAVVDDICGDQKMRIFWRHGPEAQSVFVTFASAFLVKLLQPRFTAYLSLERRLDIRDKVQRVIDLLSSPDIAIDNSHGPKLYAKFLKGLLASPMTRFESQSPATSTTGLPRSRSNRKPKLVTSPSSPTVASPTAAIRSSLSPPPNGDALSFENFAPLRGAVDPFAHGTQLGTNTQNPMGLEMSNMADFFNPPLSIDTQIMENLQTLGDPATSWTSYNWLSHFQTFQQNMGLDMASAGEMMVQDDQYNV